MKTTIGTFTLGALLLLSLLIPLFAEAGTVDVNSGGKMVFTGGAGGSKITYNYRSGTDYPYRVKDETAPVNVPGDSKKCKEVGEVAVCKGVSEGSLFKLGEGNDSFISRAKEGLGISVFGSKGIDYMLGGKEKSDLNGGDDEDTILAGPGKSDISGGGGVDFITTTAGGKDTVTCSGRDLVFVGKGDVHIGCRPTNVGPAFNTTCRGREWIYPSGNNEVVMSSATDMAIGSPGRNIFYGMRGDDCLWGRGDTDRLYGEQGDDILASGTGADFLKGGRGKDLMVGEQEAAPKDSKSFGANDGEKDKIICAPGDIAVTDKKDRVVGCRDYVAAPDACRSYRQGSDSSGEIVATRDTFARLGNGDDVFRGSNDGDCAWGEGGNDRLFGYSGRDILFGGSGNDKVLGNRGPDLIVGSRGNDRLFGDRGRDKIKAADGQRDFIKCGPGRDRVVADKIDRVRGDCESVKRKRF